MAVEEVVNELVEKLTRIENEMKLLQDDKKVLFDEYKEQLDLKAFKAAIRIAKIKSKLGESSEIELDNMLDTVEDKLTVE
tara:strand:- start:248 stop:487 length:240 start_codon:yes stop_codon:yes gene_type:complete